VPAHLIAPPPQLAGQVDARKYPATRHEHLVPHDPPSSSQSRFSSSVLNSAIGAAPLKSAALGEPRPPFFLAWTLTKVVHLMDLFSFYPGGSETHISRRHPPSPTSPSMTASVGASPPLLRPLCAEEKCRGVRRAPGAARGYLHHTRDVTDRRASASSHRRTPTVRASVSGPRLLTPPLLLSNAGRLSVWVGPSWPFVAPQVELAASLTGPRLWVKNWTNTVPLLILFPDSFPN
jgi:hypothetical protein